MVIKNVLRMKLDDVNIIIVLEASICAISKLYA